MWFEATQVVTAGQSGHRPPAGWASPILPVSHWDTPRARPCTQETRGGPSGGCVNHTAPLSSHRLGRGPGDGGGPGETLRLEVGLRPGRTSSVLSASGSPLLGPRLPQRRARACHCDGDWGVGGDEAPAGGSWWGPLGLTDSSKPPGLTQDTCKHPPPSCLHPTHIYGGPCSAPVRPGVGGHRGE